MPNVALMIINLSTILQVNASSDRLVELMDVPITEPGTEVPFSLNKGQIDVVDVEFSYPMCEDVQVLRGVNINVSAEQRVIALVGSSGSGKSSIISLIEQFY